VIQKKTENDYLFLFVPYFAIKVSGVPILKGHIAVVFRLHLVPNNLEITATENRLILVELHHKNLVILLQFLGEIPCR